MRIESLYPKPVREDFATCAQVRDDAAATYGTKARDLLDRSGGDAIGAISLLMLAADQRKAQEISKATEPTLSEQALAATVREQRDTIDQLKGQVNLYRGQVDHYRGQWKAAVDEAASIHADLCQQEVNAEQITRLQSILCAATATAYGRARMYSEDLHALPIGTVVRDEADQAWTRIDDEDGGVWATPTGDDTLTSADLVAGSSIYLAWVADL